MWISLPERDAGFRIIYVPAAKARHSGGHSAGKLAWSDRQVFWYGSLLRYACRHFSTNSSRVVSLAVILGGVVRMAVVSVVKLSFQPVPVYAKVIRLAAGYLRKGERG
jgi:GT2 family glycosyltransferase